MAAPPTADSLKAALDAARGLALGGHYNDAVAVYVDVLRRVKARLRTLTDSAEQAEWAKLKSDVKLEAKLTLALSRELDVFAQPPGGGDAGAAPLEQPRQPSPPRPAAARTSPGACAEPAWLERQPLRPPSPELPPAAALSSSVSPALPSLDDVAAALGADDAATAAFARQLRSSSSPRSGDDGRPPWRSVNDVDGDAAHQHQPLTDRLGRLLQTYGAGDAAAAAPGAAADRSPPTGLAAAFYRHRQRLGRPGASDSDDDGGGGGGSISAARRDRVSQAAAAPSSSREGRRRSPGDDAAIGGHLHAPRRHAGGAAAVPTRHPRAGDCGGGGGYSSGSPPPPPRYGGGGTGAAAASAAAAPAAAHRPATAQPPHYNYHHAAAPAPATQPQPHARRATKKPAVPRQTPPPARAAAGHGAAAGGGSGGGKPRYSDAHPLSADRELIAMVEGDMLETDPGVAFADIAGLDAAKALVQEAVVLPMLLPGYFRGIRRPWKGVLLFGPPGTGKTLLAKAVATECRTTFFNVTASTLTSKWRGESERILRLVFDMARYHAPSVVFFDEIDALAGSRGGPNEHEASRRVKTEMLVQMDGIASSLGGGGGSGDGTGAPPQVVVLAASNLPWELDDAFRRRFEKRIFIPLPSLADRRALLAVALRDIALAPGVDLDGLAAATEGFSGADVTTLCRTAAMMPIRRLLEAARAGGGGGVDAMRRVLADAGISDADASQLQLPVEAAHFAEALACTKPSLSGAESARYEAWMAEFGSV